MKNYYLTYNSIRYLLELFAVFDWNFWKCKWYIKCHRRWFVWVFSSYTSSTRWKCYQISLLFHNLKCQFFLADWGSELQQELSCSFPFQKYEGRVDLLGAEQWKTGRAIQIFVSKENILRFVHKSNWLVCDIYWQCLST